jgi:hypothetical protein
VSFTLASYSLASESHTIYLYGINSYGDVSSAVSRQVTIGNTGMPGRTPSGGGGGGDGDGAAATIHVRETDHTAVIIGPVIGATVLILVVVFIVAVLLRRRGATSDISSA